MLLLVIEIEIRGRRTAVRSEKLKDYKVKELKR